jgi:tetratricopeptide (TPR) repeat protein
VRLKEFALANRAPLTVFALIAAAVLLDYGFRSSSQDYYARGIEAMHAGKFDKAVDHFSRALRQHPADPAARFGLGWAYHSKGWYEEALKQYETAAKRSADTLRAAQFNSGEIYQRLKRQDDAMAAYQAALRVNPNAADANYNLGFIHAERGQHERALELYKKAAQHDPKSTGAAYNAALMAERLGRRDEARAYYKAALAIDPNFPGAAERLKALGN